MAKDTYVEDWKAVCIDVNTLPTSFQDTKYKMRWPLEAWDFELGVKGLTNFDRRRNFWQRTISLLLQMPPQSNELSILITAMSVGCELYDAVKIGVEMGLFDKHPNVVFYGHDISPIFLRLAHQARYPSAYAEKASKKEGYLSSEENPRIVAVTSEIKKHTRILPPSDITNLKGSYDVVVGNTLNPCPKGAAKAISQRAKKLACIDEQVIFMSDDIVKLHDGSNKHPNIQWEYKYELSRR